MPEGFPERLRRLLNEKHYGKSETAWARESGVDFHTLRRALSGESEPRYTTVVKLADYVGVSYEYLETGEGLSEPPPADIEEIRARVDEALEILQSIRADIDRQSGDGSP